MKTTVTSRISNRPVSDMPNICVAVYSFDVGGSETLAVGLIRHYLDLGATVCCVATRRGRGPLQRTLEKWGVECLALGLERHSPLVRSAMRLRLSFWLRARRVSVVHAHHFSILGDLRAAALIARVRRIVVTEHTSDMILNDSGIRRAVKKLAPKADFCTAINIAVRNAISEVSGLAKDRIVIIENGVDTDRFIPRDNTLPDSTITIAWIGRLHPDKDIATCLKAFRIAEERANCEIRLLVAGDGQDLAEAQGLIRDARLEGKVEMLGTVDDVVPVLHQSHIFFMSSRNEGTPLALLEAMSCGLPVVATAVGGIPDCTTKTTATLCPRGDVEQLADALVAIAEDKSRRSAMGLAARELVIRRFSAATMNRLYTRLVVCGEAPT